MIALNDSDLVAIRRAFIRRGRGGALAEMRRRWRAVSDAAASGVLDRILALPIDAPAPAGMSKLRRDGAGSKRRRPW